MTDEVLDSETIWKLYSPKPNPWFSSRITYKGWGTATFEKPIGTIEGPTRIVIDETGEMKIEMEYKKINTEITVYGIGNFKFIKFIQGSIGSKKTENQIAWGTGNFNPCSKLTVQTKTGTFTSSGKVHCFPCSESNKCKFSLSEGIFEATPSRESKYWVIPLKNFISTFRLYHDLLLTQHPLRLFITQPIPDVSDEKQKNIITYIANRANLFIVFYFGEKLGYIQPTLDYSEKEKKLKSGKSKQCITALMISEITSHLEEVWFPHDYTDLLSFALGTKISAPWIEFRDEYGNLISRKHLFLERDEYQDEYAVINETFYEGLGHLITVASKSPEFGKSYFRVLIGHLVRLQSYSRQIEDHMDLLCRTFETLGEEFGLGVQNLITYLPNNYQAEVKAILKDANEKIKKLPSKIDKAARPNLQPILQQIASKVENSRNIDRAFGLTILDLLKKYDLPDAFIMEKHCATFPRGGDKSWAQLLTKYRGATVHTGYFAKEKYDIWDILELEDHLQDVLVRIALKTLNYKGYYRPRIKHHLAEGKPINWVTDQTTATELGYSEEK